MKERNLTRREFLKAGSIVTAGAIFMNSPIEYFAGQGSKAKVVLIRNEKVFGCQWKS